MDGKRHLLTPQKRSNEGSNVWILNKRTYDSDGVSSASERVYKLKILLPNGTAVLVKIPEGKESITVRELADIVKQQFERATQAEQTLNSKKNVRWDADLRLIDDYDRVFKTFFKLTRLDINRVYNLRLDDGSQPPTIYKNMWEITSDTELLAKLPEEYTFEIALADLIDGSLQTVWANDEYEKSLISVEVSDDKISIFDTGMGMNSLSIEKWGKMGASLNRANETQEIGGKPPYLTPAFRTFGYGGFIASMHLGRRAEISSKTKIGNKVFMLRLERDAFTSASVSSSKGSLRTYGGLREPTIEELALSPFGSFTKVEIFGLNMRCTNIRRLKCLLKDIYYPYIQRSGDFSQNGIPIMPLKFQVNGDDLAELPSGEVAITNLATCIGPEFILQVRFKLNHTMASSQGSSEEANARIRCVYLPVKKGQESIEKVFDALKEEGYDYAEELESFHVSCRWLGRLLPNARWEWLPFMDLRQRNMGRSQVFLKTSCMRVKCFIETDAGFSPTPSKTGFAPQNPFTSALMNLGRQQTLEKDSGVDIDIRKDGKPLSLTQLDKKYKLWLRQMHDRYEEDEEKPTAARQQEADIEYFNQLQKDRWNGILEIGLRIGKLEREIKMLEDERNTIEVKLTKCEGIRGNRDLSQRCMEPDIVFPVAPARNQLSQDVTRVLNHDIELKSKLEATNSELGEKRKSHESALKSFYTQRDIFVKYITQL